MRCAISLPAQWNLEQGYFMNSVIFATGFQRSCRSALTASIVPSAQVHYDAQGSKHVSCRCALQISKVYAEGEGSIWEHDLLLRNMVMRATCTAGQ